MIYQGLPLYNVEFDEDTSVFNNVAIVTEPAIEVPFIRLSKQEEPRIRLKIDEERRLVSGPALIPEEPIYRNQDGRRFYIKYTADTIKRMALNFFKKDRQNEGNVEHAVPVNGITYFESYIIDKGRGINPKEFDLPDGTWILTAKVENDDVWDLIKSGDLTGFSIDIANVRFSEDKEIDNLEDFINYLNENYK